MEPTGQTDYQSAKLGRCVLKIIYQCLSWQSLWKYDQDLHTNQNFRSQWREKEKFIGITIDIVAGVDLCK